MDCVLFLGKKNWRQAALKTDLDFPVVVSLKMRQIASLGSQGSMLLDPSRLLNALWALDARHRLL